MSRLQFRNVDADPRDPVASWPYEALVTAIERGALSDWRRIDAELRQHPWGRVASDLEAYLDYAERTGATALMERALVRARLRASEADAGAVASEVRELVKRSGLRQAEFAQRAATSPSRLSTYCTGKVTPSATLMRRFERVAAQDG